MEDAFNEPILPFMVSTIIASQTQEETQMQGQIEDVSLDDESIFLLSRHDANVYEEQVYEPYDERLVYNKTPILTHSVR